MNYQKYLSTPTIPTDPILEDWRWLIGPTLKLWRITLTGDAFLLDPSDNSIHFLDTISGTVEKVAPDEAGFEASLNAAHNADRWLMPDVVNGQAALGMRPGPNQCLSFEIPPALGGQLHPDNIELCEVTVHFSIRRPNTPPNQRPPARDENHEHRHFRRRQRDWHPTSLVEILVAPRLIAFSLPIPYHSRVPNPAHFSRGSPHDPIA
jgi:hypothetical protein